MADLIVQALVFLLMITVSAVAFSLIYVRVMRGGFSNSRFDASVGGIPEVNFSDVLGADEALREAREVVEFLHDAKEFAAVGARVPRGVLLVGPPGTGKTLLAKAIAHEAKVPFYRLSGAEFVEVFVGVGASRIRSLYKKARKHPAAIVFIDEIDALGRSRVFGQFGGQESNQTLNQFLVELDGFGSDSGMVITIGATNMEETLDPALLRPGRFDRKIHVGLPDMRGRQAILEHYLAAVKADPRLDVPALARACTQMSGADLATLVNEAGILAVRHGRKVVSQDDLSLAMERLGIGLERPLRLSEEERRIVAYHEAGHALVGLAVAPTKRLHKVSIIPTGRQALGYTWAVDRQDRFLSSTDELCADLAVLMGGRAAEERVFGRATSGAASDLERAAAIADRMVLELGLGGLGPRYFRDRT
ncbi:MAG: AAA family ATPase, partial [Cyanobacteria bacterium REEB65]|nr:AAA family ATPase [Cyanobacteria bacterium REEB65]